MRRFADSYINELISRSDYESMVDLQGILLSSSRINADVPDYGLPSIGFVFVESIMWISQSMRSGVWTYFESVPIERQVAMFHALELFAPLDFAQSYKFGSENWRDTEQIKQIDRWIDETDQDYIKWLARLQRKNRTTFWPLYA